MYTESRSGTNGHSISAEFSERSGFAKIRQARWETEKGNCFKQKKKRRKKIVQLSNNFSLLSRRNEEYKMAHFSSSERTRTHPLQRINQRIRKKKRNRKDRQGAEIAMQMIGTVPLTIEHGRVGQLGAFIIFSIVSSSIFSVSSSSRLPTCSHLDPSTPSRSRPPGTLSGGEHIKNKCGC